MQFLVEISGVKARTSAIRFPLAEILSKMSAQMEKKILSLIFCILSLSIFGQKRLFSPFKLADYENLKNEYINAAVENDSLLILVDNYYLIKKKLDSIPNVDNNLKSIFRISKNDFKYYYRPKHNDLSIDFPNSNLKIVYWFQGDTNSEFINNEKIRTWNIYFTKNGQLKQTSTNLLSNNDQIGISEEFNIIGKRLFYANWDKDFQLTKSEIISLAEKYFLLDLEKINPEMKSEDIKKIIFEINNNKPNIYKIIDGDRNAIWLVKFQTIGFWSDIIINDRTKKLVEIKKGWKIE